MDAKENDFKSTELSDAGNATKHSFVLPAALTAILFFAAALIIVIATRILWPLPLGTGVRQIVLSIFNGMLLSLPVLVSLWMGLGRQTWFIRIPLATLFLAALLGIYLETIRIEASNVSKEVFWLFAGITLGVTVSIQIPLWIARLWRGVVISRTGSASSAKTQFTIKQLMIATTILAFLVPTLQLLGQFYAARNGGGPSAGDAFGFCGIFIVVLMFLLLLSVLIVFSTNFKTRFASLCVFAVVINALPFAVVPSIIFLTTDFAGVNPMDVKDMRINVFTFSLSNALTNVAVLSMYRVLGFRLWKEI